MTGEECERKFSDLSRFSPHLVDNKLKRAQKFRYGLLSEIRNVISGQGITTLAETFEQAEEIAASISMDAPKVKEDSGKRKWEDSNTGDQNKKLRIQGSGEQGDKLISKTCGRNHWGAITFTSFDLNSHLKVKR